LDNVEGKVELKNCGKLIVDIDVVLARGALVFRVRVALRSFVSGPLVIAHLAESFLIHVLEVSLLGVPESDCSCYEECGLRSQVEPCLEAGEALSSVDTLGNGHIYDFIFVHLIKVS